MIKTPFNILVLGFVFFNIIADVFLKISNGNQFIIALTKLIGLYFILKGYFSLRKYSLNPFDSRYRFLLILYNLICVVMIIRGYMIDYQYLWISSMGMINYHLFQPFYILCYLMPLVTRIDYKYFNYGFIMDLALKCAKISIVLFVIAFPFLLEESSNRLSNIGKAFEGNVSESSFFLPYTVYTFFSFFVFLGRYQSRRDWLWHWGGLLTVFLGGILLGRRGRSFIIVLYMIFPLYMWIQQCKKGKMLACIMMASFIGLTAYFFVNSSIFSFIASRGLQDTRSGVDIALMNQMNDWEKIFGKGLNGRYYYPLHEDDYLNGWRYSSETGFYNLVLKGGYLMAFVYIALLLIPSLNGMFKSKNVLCKASGYYIFVSLLELYPFGWLMFDLKFLVIWMGVVICMNPYIRYMNDEQIYETFFLRKNV
jgi:hypothetical protein